MKKHLTRPPLIIIVLIASAFLLSWYPSSRFKAFRAEALQSPVILTHDGAISYERPPELPAPDLERHPYFNAPRLAGPTDRVTVIIELEDEPAVAEYARHLSGRPGERRRQSTRSMVAARERLARIDRAQREMTGRLAAPPFRARILSRVQRVYNGLIIEVEAGKLPELRRTRGVRSVNVSIPMYRATDTTPAWIGADRFWDNGYTGSGVVVSVIDSGVDYNHPALTGSGLGSDYALNDPTIIGDVNTFPNTAVIGGFDFSGDAFDAGDPANNTPVEDPDPYDCNSHGTKAAGVIGSRGVNLDGTTFAGPYNQNTPSGQLKVAPGVAPDVSLLIYKIFGCQGSTNTALVLRAIDRSLDPNMDGDFSDHADIINLSIISPYSPYQDTDLSNAIDAASAAGVIFTGAAGNLGPTHYAAGAPGIGRNVISVAGSHDNGFSFQNVTVNNQEILGDYPAAVAEFGPGLSSTLTSNAAMSSPADGCAPITNQDQIAGRIALIDRGMCSLVTKVRNAQAAGALAAIVFNDTPGLPGIMGDDGTGYDIDIPSFLLDSNASTLIKNQLGNLTINLTLNPNNILSNTDRADTLVSSSSRGGVFNNLVKPDISAPGANIKTAYPGPGANFGWYNGTSMSSPHVAGVAALLLQSDPSLTSQDAYSRMISSANPIYSGLNNGLPREAPSAAGAGQLNADGSFENSSSVNHVTSASGIFGNVTSVINDSSQPINLTLNNTGGSNQSYTITYEPVSDLPGVDLTFPPALTAAAGSSTNFQIRWNYVPAGMKHLIPTNLSATQSGAPRHWLSEESGYLRFSASGGETLWAPVHTSARPASEMATTQTSIDLTGQTGTFALGLTGKQVHTGNTFPTDVISLVSPYTWLETGGDDPSIKPALDYFDLNSIGVRSNIATSGSIGNAVINIGISTIGEWDTPNQVRFNVFFDTDEDGNFDYQLYNTVFPNEVGAPSDVFVTRLTNLDTGTSTTEAFVNSFSAGQFDTALFNTNVVSLPVRAAGLGLTDANSDFRIQVATSLENTIMDQSRIHSFDAANPVFNFGANTMYFDLNGGTIPVSYAIPAAQNRDYEGVMLIHHHNSGIQNRVQLLPGNFGLEGDVDPRTTGDGDVDNEDWVTFADLLLSQGGLNPGNEFQRADTWPAGDSKGDGNIDLGDFVQNGRYSAGIDQAQRTGGPYLPVIIKPRSAGSDSGKSSLTGQTAMLRVVDAALTHGQPNSLSIELDAQGGENAVAFTLNFDPAELGFVSASLGNIAPGSLLVVNSTQAAAGFIGIVLGLPPGQSLVAGRRTILTVSLNPLQTGRAITTAVRLSDDVVPRQLADATGNPLGLNSVDGTATIIRTAAGVSAASFLGTSLASESIVAAFGALLATQVEVADSVPLPTSLAGSTVTVRDAAGAERLAPLFFVSPGQINFQIAPGTVNGQGLIRIVSGDGAVSTGNVNITSVAPGIFSANANGQGVAAAVLLRVRGDGSQSFEPVIAFDQAMNQFVPVPIDLGPETDQVFLIMFGTGIRLRSSLAAVTATVGNLASEVLYAGEQGGFVGLDQLNLRLIRALIGRGVVEIALNVDGQPANIVTIEIGGAAFRNIK